MEFGKRQLKMKNGEKQILMMSFGQKNQFHQISSIFSHHALKPFNMSHRAKTGAKMAKQGEDVLMSNHYHVVTS